MKHCKNFILSVIFISVLCLVISKVNYIFERDYSYKKYAEFYEEEEDFDVLFLGTSHMINGVFPMELWADYGVTSYNLANYSEVIATNYWQLQNALKYTTPKLVVVDLYAIAAIDKANESFMHNFTDAVPFSLFKIKMIHELMPKELRVEYLFELTRYHDRWTELTKNDLNKSVSPEKGGELRAEWVYNETPAIIEQSDYSEVNSTSTEYLEKIIRLCKAQNIDVLLVYLPFNANDAIMREANYGYVLAEKYQVPYLNFFYEDVGINFSTDFSDENSHLNVSGGVKVTDFLGNYIVENYEDIVDKRQEEEFASWRIAEERYDMYIQELIEEVDEVGAYLSLLNRSKYQIRVRMTEDSTLYQDTLIWELIQNINTQGNLMVEYLSDDCYEGNFFIEVLDEENRIISRKAYTRVEDNVYERYE